MGYFRKAGAMGALKNSTEERRRFNRIEDNIFIFCSCKRQREQIEAIVRNIGSGGLMFRTDTNLLPEDLLELEIYEPVDINKSLIVAIDAVARVAWTKRIENNIIGSDRLAVGLEFIEIGKEDRDRIRNYITKQQNRWRKEKRI
jgi:c-di-GMP-binding flagellar brake protein YcgR